MFNQYCSHELVNAPGSAPPKDGGGVEEWRRERQKIENFSLITQGVERLIDFPFPSPSPSSSSSCFSSQIPSANFIVGGDKGWFYSESRVAAAVLNSMSTHSPRRPLKGYLRDSCQRKMVLNVDLNEIPPLEDRDLEVISTGTESQEAQTSVQGGGLLPPVTIDVDAIDDDVLISSPRSFAQARNNSRRYNSGDSINRLSLNGYNERIRVSPDQTTINSELYINLESKDTKNELKPPEPAVPLPREEEPKFNCPVCMGQLFEETSTKCGHIFCKKCIRTAISAQNKCPTCRRRLTMRDIIRIYLPSAN